MGTITLRANADSWIWRGVAYDGGRIGEMRPATTRDGLHRACPLLCHEGRLALMTDLGILGVRGRGRARIPTDGRALA